ncbi:acyl carrier protein [Streptomyces sp. NPDC001070]
MTYEQMRDWIVGFLAELLDVAPHEIDPTLPLDHLGFDSATTLDLCGRLEEDLGIDTTPKAIADHPTVDALAAHLARPAPLGEVVPT